MNSTIRIELEAAQEMVRLIVNDYPAGNLDGLAIVE